MGIFGIRKLVGLFKRSKPTKTDEHERLFPLVPSPPAGRVRSHSSTIIDRLIRRTRAKPADSVLSTHTVTVTSTEQNSGQDLSKSPTTPDGQSSQTAGALLELSEVDDPPAEIQEQHESLAIVIDIPPKIVDTSTQTSPSLPSAVEEYDISNHHDVKGEPTVLAGKLDFSPIKDLFQLAPSIQAIGSSALITSSDSSGEEPEVTLDDCCDQFIEEHRSAKSLDLTETISQIIPTVVDEEHREKQLVDEKNHGLSTDSSSDTSEEEDEELVDPEVLRGDWESIIGIPVRNFALALLQHLPEGHGVSIDDITCIEEIKGGFSFVRILQVDNGVHAGQYVVKVPCTGTASRWQEADAYMLRNDARTLSYITKNTTIPSPEVLGFSDSLSSVLGAPYLIMRANKGIPSNKIWFDQDEDGDDDLINAHLPYEERMVIRANFLRSLASQMAKLQALEFDGAGTLNFDNDAEYPTVGPTYHWKAASDLIRLSIDDLSTPDSIQCVPPFHTSGAYFMTALNELWAKDEKPRSHINNGRRHIMACMLAFPPFDKSQKTGDKRDTFVLRHDDLDFQNILCDEKGNVTAIIDWDKVRVAPRCLGFAALPIFLTKDWSPNFTTAGDVHMPWELDEYRNVYARAMLEATGPTGDGKYTIKSAVYEAVNSALYGGHNGGSIPNLVRRVIKELTTTRKFDDADILTALGEGWDQGGVTVNHDIVKLIAPQSEVEAIEPKWYDGE